MSINKRLFKCALWIITLFYLYAVGVLIYHYTTDTLVFSYGDAVVFSVFSFVFAGFLIMDMTRFGEGTRTVRRLKKICPINENQYGWIVTRDGVVTAVNSVTPSPSDKNEFTADVED